MAVATKPARRGRPTLSVGTYELRKKNYMGMNWRKAGQVRARTKAEAIILFKRNANMSFYFTPSFDGEVEIVRV